MRLRFLGKDSTPTNSPTLYATDHDSYIVQGWIITEPDLLSGLSLTDEETIVEISPALLSFLSADGLSGEIDKIVQPVVHVLPNGNLIIKGRRVSDPEALGQMNIPDHETCVEVMRTAVESLLVGG